MQTDVTSDGHLVNRWGIEQLHKHCQLLRKLLRNAFIHHTFQNEWVVQ